MHLWQLSEWKNYYDNPSIRKGLHLRFENSVNQGVRLSILKFCRWIRQEFYFPIRVVVYVKAAPYIVAKDKSKVYATFFGPENHMQEPYIKLSTGQFDQLLTKEVERDDALCIILTSLAHELSHYFQWINDVELTEIGQERQASIYARAILAEYSEVVEHP